MAHFKYYEDDYELAVLELLENCGWEYQCGYDVHREKDDIILLDDFQEYLSRKYGYFSEDELHTLISYITSYSNQSLYRSMKETYKILTRGYTLHRDDGTDQFIDFFDFGKDAETINVFRAVNQFEFAEYHNRRPDIVLFINGIPVSVFELKNPADETVSIADAYAQTHIRYAQDIPSLMKFDFINVISDGANTRYGSLFSSYEFYFKWNSTNGEDYSNADGIESIHVLIRGLFAHRTVLNILSSYIYFPDNSDSSLLILPKYYQYYGAEKMYAHILEEYEAGSGKGGTYWGATGCGKSYNGTYRDYMKKLRKEKLLILDEWLLYPLKEAEARDVLELVEARNKVASTIFCSQYDTSEWHENLYDPTLADAICDRIIYNAYTIQIEGESMRKRKGIPE